MKIIELKQMMDADSRMDISALDEESLKTPMLHGKYYALLMEEMKILRDIETEYNTLYKFKFEYYTGRCNDDIYEEHPLDVKVVKQDLEIYMNADEDLIVLLKRVKAQKTKVDMVQNYISNVINVRGFQIKSAIDFLKFKNGVS